MLGNSKGTLGSTELEGGCVPVALAAGTTVSKGKLHQKPGPRHILHTTCTQQYLQHHLGFVLDITWPKCETGPISGLDRLGTIQCKKELPCPVNTSPPIVEIMQSAEIHCFYPMHQNTSVHSRPNKSVFHCLAAPQKSTTARKPTSFWKER